MTGNLEGDVRYLRDRTEILDVIHRFVSEADKRSVEGMASCVSEDAIVSFNDGALVIEGVDHLRRYMTNQFATTGTLNPDTRGTHAMCNSIVKIDGDTATAETSGVTYLATPAKMVHIRGVRYNDRLARIDGQWRLTDRRHSCGWQIDTPGYTQPPILETGSK